MDHKYNNCNHTNCTATNSNRSVCQTLSEMDWERGIWNAAFNGEYEKVRNIIEKAKNKELAVNAPDNSGYTALHYGARNGHVDVCQMLLQNGADINAVTRSGNATPLLKAVAAGKLNTVQLLIQSGACLLIKDADGKSVLHKAIDYKKLEVSNYLLDICPELAHMRDNKGNLPLVLEEN